MADFNINSKDTDKILKKASQKAGIDINELKNAAQSGNMDDFIGKNLSEEAGQKLRCVLSDKSAAEKLLNTKEARELLNKLLGK